MQAIGNGTKGKYSNMYSTAATYFATKDYKAYNGYIVKSFIHTFIMVDKE